MSLKDEIGIFIGNGTKLVAFVRVLVLLHLLAAVLTAITGYNVGGRFVSRSGGIIASGILVRVIIVFLAFAAITLPGLCCTSWWITVRLHKILHGDSLVPKDIAMAIITGLAVLIPSVIVFLLFTIDV